MKKSALCLLTVVGLSFSFCSAPDNSPETSEGPKLPHSMKGYELYAWKKGVESSFTLTTGTNRQKTIEEITEGSDSGQSSKFVRIVAKRKAEILETLKRFPKGETLTIAGSSWMGNHRGKQLDAVEKWELAEVAQAARAAGWEVLD